MNNVSRIPEETGSCSIISNVEVDIDSNGLECVIKPDGADIFVKTRPCDNKFFGGYLVKDGQEFTFCGKVYFYSNATCEVYYMKYRTL